MNNHLGFFEVLASAFSLLVYLPSPFFSPSFVYSTASTGSSNYTFQYLLRISLISLATSWLENIFLT